MALHLIPQVARILTVGIPLAIGSWLYTFPQQAGCRLHNEIKPLSIFSHTKHGHKQKFSFPAGETSLFLISTRPQDRLSTYALTPKGNTTCDRSMSNPSSAIHCRLNLTDFSQFGMYSFIVYNANPYPVKYCSVCRPGNVKPTRANLRKFRKLCRQKHRS